MRWRILAAILVIAPAGLGAGRVLANAGEADSWVAPGAAGGAFVVRKTQPSPAATPEETVTAPSAAATAVPGAATELARTPESTPSPNSGPTRATELKPTNPASNQTAVPTAPYTPPPVAPSELPAKTATAKPASPNTKPVPTASATNVLTVLACPKAEPLSASNALRCVTPTVRK